MAVASLPATRHKPSKTRRAVQVAVKGGNNISAEAFATLPPVKKGDFTGERAVWKGKFYISH